MTGRSRKKLMPLGVSSSQVIYEGNRQTKSGYHIRCYKLIVYPEEHTITYV